MQNFTFVPSNEYSISLMKTIGRQIITQSPKIANVNINESHINEVLLKKETPVKYIDRISKTKAETLWQEGENVLAVHIAFFVGRRLILTPQNEEEARKTLTLYSGRNHVVYASVCLKKADGTISQKRTFTRIKLRNLNQIAAEEFIASKQWQSQIGGYTPQGLMQKHIIKITGSHSGWLGLPCYEAENLVSQI